MQVSSDITDPPQARRRRLQSHQHSRYAWLGLAAICMATILAVASVGIDPQRPGALRAAALWLLGGMLVVPVMRLRQGLWVILRPEHILMLGLCYWLVLDLLQGLFPLYGVGRDHIVIAIVSIGVMAGGIWLGSIGRGWPLPGIVVNTTRSRITDSALNKAIWLTFILGMSKFVIGSDFDLYAMFHALGESRWSAPWARGRLGGWDAFRDHMQYFGYVLPALTVVLSHRRGWLHPPVLIGIVLSIVMVLFLSQGGGRRVTGVVIGAALLCWLLLQARLNLRTLSVAALVTALLLVFMQQMLTYRNVGFKALQAGDIKTSQYGRLHVDDNFYRLTQIIQFIPETHPYAYFQPVIYAMIRPVPRVFWPGKPTTPGYDLPALNGMKGVSLTTSIIGELYASFGLLAVFIGAVVLGRLARMWSRIRELPGSVSGTLTYSLGLMAMFAGLRSMQDLVIMSYGLLGWFVISYLVALRGQRLAQSRTTS